jgi:hypothetical protein
MGPRNAYKDMLNKVVSLIACVNMNHQNQLEQMANRYNLSYDVCFVSEDMCVDCAYMSKWKQWEMDRIDLSMRTDSKETMINKPPSHLFTDATLLLHGNWVLSDFNYWALKLVTGIKCSLVTDFVARYQYGVISNGLKQPVTDRALISNGLY